MASGGFTVTVPADCPVRPEYVLGLLNSKLLVWNLRQVSNVFRGGWITCTKQYFGALPIRIVDVSDASGKRVHDEIVSLVERMLELHRQLAASRGESDKPSVERLIAATDAEIDRLVYELYGLTDTEISIIEGAARP